MKNKISIVLFIVTILALPYVNRSFLNNIENMQFQNSILDYNPSNHVYYTLHPGGGLEDQISLYYDDLNFGTDKLIDDKISSLSSVSNIYPYVGLTFSEKGVSITVNEKNYSFTDESMRYLLLPYYPEDNLDNENNKVFINSFLALKLKEQGIDILGQDVVIDNVRIPVSSHEIEVEGIRGDKPTAKYYPMESDYSYQTIQLHIDSKMVDSYSTIYNSNKIIYIPYSMLSSILDQYRSDNNSPYEIYARVAFSNDDISKEIMALDDRLSSLKDMNITPYQSQDKSLSLGLVILLMVAVIGMHVLLKFETKKDIFIYLAETLAGLIGFSFIYFKSFSLSYLLVSLIEIVIMMVVFSHRSTKNAK